MRESAHGPYLTPRQVAERYGVAPEKVLAWIRDGELAAVNVASRTSTRPCWRISPAALNAFERLRSATFKKSKPKKKRKRNKKKSKHKKRSAKTSNIPRGESVPLNPDFINNAVLWSSLAFLVLFMLNAGSSVNDLWKDILAGLLLLMGKTNVQIKIK